jgi:hypothetical protein
MGDPTASESLTEVSFCFLHLPTPWQRAAGCWLARVRLGGRCQLMRPHSTILWASAHVIWMSFPMNMTDFITLFFKMDGYRIKVEVEREVLGGSSSNPPPPKPTVGKGEEA